MSSRPERTPYEAASVVFAAIVIGFAVAGMLISGLGDGPGSAGFLVCCLFLALGAGRLCLGLRRGGEERTEAASGRGGGSIHSSRRSPPRRAPRRRRR